MPKKPENMSLDELEAHRKEVAAALRAKKRAERSKSRASEDRRKIVAGAIALKHMEHDAAFKAQFTALLDRFATRNIDRELFGLPERPEPSPEPQPATAPVASSQPLQSFPHAS